MAPQPTRAAARPTWVSTTPPRRRRPGYPPSPAVADALGVLAVAGLVVVVGLALWGESRASLASPGGWWLAAGRLFAFTGTYLLLVMVLLMARLPALERAVGQDRLVRWHRTIGGWPIVLIGAHIVSVVVGYAALTHSGWLHQLWSFLVNYPDVLAAAVAFGLLVLAGVSSWRAARSRDALRDLVGRAPLRLPGPGARPRPPDPHRRAVRRPPAGRPPLARRRGRRRRARRGQPGPLAPRLQPALASARGRGLRGRPGRLLADRLGPAPRAPGRVGRAVLPVALHRPGSVVAQPPLLALGAAPAAVPARHRQGPRRPVRRRRAPRAGHARRRRGPLWRVHPPRARDRPSRPGRRRGRRDTAARAARGPRPRQST